MGLLKYELLAVVKLPVVKAPVLRWLPLLLLSQDEALREPVPVCSPPLHERRHHIQRHEVTEGVSLHSVKAAVSICAAAALCAELAAPQHGSLKGGPLGPQLCFPACL